MRLSCRPCLFGAVKHNSLIVRRLPACNACPAVLRIMLGNACRTADVIEPDICAAFGTSQDMTEISDQSVGNINRGMGAATQCYAQLYSGLRAKVMQRYRFPGLLAALLLLAQQTECRIAELTRHPDVVSGLCCVYAAAPMPCGTSPMMVMRWRAAARGIAADQIDAKALRAFKKTFGEARQPSFIDFRQRQGKCCPSGVGTHCCEIRPH